jgi:hypothetical protein
VYQYDRRNQQVRRLQTAGGVVAVIVLAVLAYTIGSATAPRSELDVAGDPQRLPPVAASSPSVTTSASPSSRPGSRLPQAVASTDPVESAVTWLRAYRAVRFDDGTASAWIDRVRPVVTARLRAEYERYRNGSTGAEWNEFVEGRCETSVEDAGGVIPDEAPRTATNVNVQVAGSVTTHCDEGVVAAPPEAVAATVQLVRGSDGRWRVSRRLH